LDRQSAPIFLDDPGNGFILAEHLVRDQGVGHLQPCGGAFGKEVSERRKVTAQTLVRTPKQFPKQCNRYHAHITIL
jgi:hypothetical protein